MTLSLVVIGGKNEGAQYYMFMFYFSAAAECKFILFLVRSKNWEVGYSDELHQLIVNI